MTADQNFNVYQGKQRGVRITVAGIAASDVSAAAWAAAPAADQPLLIEKTYTGAPGDTLLVADDGQGNVEVSFSIEEADTAELSVGVYLHELSLTVSGVPDLYTKGYLTIEPTLV